MIQVTGQTSKPRRLLFLRNGNHTSRLSQKLSINFEYLRRPRCRKMHLPIILLALPVSGGLHYECKATGVSTGIKTRNDIFGALLSLWDRFCDLIRKPDAWPMRNQNQTRLQTYISQLCRNNSPDRKPEHSLEHAPILVE